MSEVFKNLQNRIPNVNVEVELQAIKQIVTNAAQSAIKEEKKTQNIVWYYEKWVELLSMKNEDSMKNDCIAYKIIHMQTARYIKTLVICVKRRQRPIKRTF